MYIYIYIHTYIYIYIYIYIYTYIYIHNTSIYLYICIQVQVSVSVYNDLYMDIVRVVNPPFKYQSHKMVKHTQTICRQQPTNCLSVFDHFVVLALKVLVSCFTENIAFTCVFSDCQMSKTCRFGKLFPSIMSPICFLN